MFSDPLPNCQEELGWKEFGGRCYKVVTNKLAWAGAEADCMSMGAHLVGIGTEQEQLFVANEVNTLNEHMWIGLSSVVSNELAHRVRTLVNLNANPLEFLLRYLQRS